MHIRPPARALALGLSLLVGGLAIAAGVYGYLDTRADVAALAERAAAVEAAAAPLAPALARIEVLEEQVGGIAPALARIEALEEQVGEIAPALALFIVANTDMRPHDPPAAFLDSDLCITYTVPGGVQERCKFVAYEQTGENIWSVTPTYQWVFDCYSGVRIGEPLPACWR